MIGVLVSYKTKLRYKNLRKNCHPKRLKNYLIFIEIKKIIMTIALKKKKKKKNQACRRE